MFSICMQSMMLRAFIVSSSLLIASSMAFQPVPIQFDAVKCSLRSSPTRRMSDFRMCSSSEGYPLAPLQSAKLRSNAKHFPSIKPAAPGRHGSFRNSKRQVQAMQALGRNLCALRKEAISLPKEKSSKNLLMYMLKIFFRAGLVFVAMVAAMAHQAMAHMVALGPRDATSDNICRSVPVRACRRQRG